MAGFTLIELLVVFTIASVLLAVGAPAMGTFIRNNALQAQTFELLTALKYARTEAVKRRTRVIMCRSGDPTATTPTCGGTTRNWSTGWLVFASGDTNSTYEAASDTLIRVGEPAPGQVTIRTNSACNLNLEFNPDGTTNEGGAVGRFAICDDRGADQGRLVQVPPIGRPRLRPGSEVPMSCTNP